MLKKALTLFIIITMVVLQTTFFQFVSINNVSPNLFIITIVSLSALRGRNEGLFYAVAFGFIHDVFYGSVVGFYILIYTFIAFFSGYLYENYDGESVVIPLSVIGVADLIYNFIVYFFTYLLRGRLDLGYYIFQLILPEITYTIVVAVLLYRIYIVYVRFIFQYEKTKRKGKEEIDDRTFKRHF
ncbi:MAG: rod shape-determining protein MreD [Vallitaleaceae bacterium]|nr:rod shape-determining protein MreD [Vallitaleaceae bacterium]